MTDLTASPQNSHGKIRSKKFSTRIDMTPMVDLAFLLLTFFILTNVLKTQQVLQLFMPEEQDINMKEHIISANSVLTLVLGEHDKIYWYTGTTPIATVTDFSQHGVRKLILEKNNTIAKMWILIKASDQSRYKNLVDIMDEILIAKINRYALVDLTKEDIELIKATGQ
jgi:biopolymer transport protein ExbD